MSNKEITPVQILQALHKDPRIESLNYLAVVDGIHFPDKIKHGQKLNIDNVAPSTYVTANWVEYPEIGVDDLVATKEGVGYVGMAVDGCYYIYTKLNCEGKLIDTCSILEVALIQDGEDDE